MNRPEYRLELLLAKLQPALDPTEYAFVQLAPGAALPGGVDPLATFREDEGTSLVVTAGEAADHGLDNRYLCRRIVLQVHSALEAVGMLAAVAVRLTEAGIPSNVISAVEHDHLFVPADRTDEAMAVLAGLQQETAANRGG